MVINTPSNAIYTAFSDLRNLAINLPEEHRDKLEVTQDTISVKVQNISLGAKVHNRTPFSRVDFEQYGQSPFPFLLSLVMEPSGDDSTWFHIELKAELNPLMKMMFAKRLREGVDQVTDAIAKAASGVTPADIMEQFRDVSPRV